ncbi:MAG: hypothetical protein CL678_16950 [Bdellovibrionaceae bacterium]|nr:hypothetical protein [Pseudobdellovibrionaceae bacterium]|tara:strand:+ start:1287 stop:1772 length:486 start_codon:yes stop_codon:yes gene_type:complete
MKVDPSFFKPIVDATRKTLSIQCSVESQPGKPFMKSDPTRITKGVEIAGVIGLTSESYNGSIALCMTRPVFYSVMNGMLGEECEESIEELSDGIAELLNIIFGDAKAVLNEEGHAIQMAIPVVLVGQNLQTAAGESANSTVVLPFNTDAGEFFIEIALDKS